jgi:HD-GYP domain-containing protein (c-di-GMP phosphodiesterase class II)
MKRFWQDRTGLLSGLGIGAMLASITWVAYLAGGAGSSYLHFFYIPIVMGSYLLGDLGGIVTAFAAALLAGLLPSDTDAGTRQPAADIIVRAALFYFIGVITSRLFSKLEERREDAASLLKVSSTVNASLRATEVLRTIAETAVRITSAKACSIRLLNRERSELILAASYGLSLDYLAKGPLRLAQNDIDREVVGGQTVTVADVRVDPRFRYQEEAAQENLVSLLSIPLLKGAEVFGTLTVYSESRHQWSRREGRMLQGFAEQAGVAIHNARLHEDLRRSYWETVSALARAIEARDPYTPGHSERVTDYVLQLGGALELSAEELETLRFAATLHDIGKIGVGDEAIGHGAPLDVSDEIVVRMHPLIGISILQPVEFLAPALPIVRYHHERWDGNGYPEGLAKEEIPFLARVLAVANTYDRLQTGSPGRAAMSEADARQELRRIAGSALDPQLAELFLSLLERSR